jgi:hypothetical protein
VSSTGETTPSMARQYGGLTRKYASDTGGDELAACLPPDLRHLLSATTATAPTSQQRQTTSQRLQQHGLLRSSTATAAANSLVSLARGATTYCVRCRLQLCLRCAFGPQNNAAALSMYGGGRKPWSSTSSWSYHDDTGIGGYPLSIDRRIGVTGRHAGLFGTMDSQHYRSGGRTIATARSLGGVYDGNSLLYRCSTSNV